MHNVRGSFSLQSPRLADYQGRGKIVAICHCHIRVVRVYSANHSVSIEDAKRVEDPILFERPCNPEGLEVILKCVLHEVQRTVPKASILASTLCIEDARSLVPASTAASASKRNFSTMNAEPW